MAKTARKIPSNQLKIQNTPTPTGNVIPLGYDSLGQPVDYTNNIALTYAQAAALVASLSLRPGEYYQITDYKTKHRIPTTTVIHEGALEPLILRAISTTEFAKQVQSTTFPKDIIEYDFDNDLCEDGTTPRNGLITYRKDTVRNITTTKYDFRNTVRRLYKVTKENEIPTLLSGSEVDLLLTFSPDLSASSLTIYQQWHVAFPSVFANSAGNINITVRKGAFTFTKPLLKSNFSPTWLANELASKKGLIVYSIGTDSFVFMNYVTNGIGDSLDGLYISDTQTLKVIGNNVRYTVDNEDFVDVKTFQDGATIADVVLEGQWNTFYGNVFNSKFAGNDSNNNVFLNGEVAGVDAVNFFNNIVAARFLGVTAPSFVGNSLFISNAIPNVFLGEINQCTLLIGRHIQKLTGGFFENTTIVQAMNPPSVSPQGNWGFSMTNTTCQSSGIFLNPNSNATNTSINAHVIQSLIGLTTTVPSYLIINKLFFRESLDGTPNIQQTIGDVQVDKLRINELQTPTGAIRNIGLDENDNVVEADVISVSGTETVNFIPKFTDVKTIGNSQLFDNGTNVGIGTNSPTAKFDVVDGDAKINGLTVGRGSGNSSDNTAIGSNTLLVNTSGSRNTGIGFNTLLDNTTGNDNTAIGHRSLEDNTTGIENTAIGKFSMLLTRTGSRNTAIGSGALTGNSTTGSNNTAIGYNGLNKTTGGNNTAIGHRSLENNTTGSENVAIGSDALRLNVSAIRNTAIGARSLESNTEGFNNVAIGFVSLNSNTTGINNTAIGSAALINNTTGSNNIGFGDDAGRYIVSGGVNNTITNNSIFIGTNSKALDNDQTNQIVIGFEATGAGSNTVVIGNNSIVTTLLKGNVGIGTTAPSNTLDVNGTARIRTINNLGTAATNVLVPNATGVLHLRTAAQLLADMDGVPYTGATKNVTLGDFGIAVNHVNFDTTPATLPTTEGTTYWDVDNNTLSTILSGYTMRHGEDQFYPVKNQTGETITKGTAVGFAGTLGASGRLLISKFIANNSVPSTSFMGIAAQDIADGSDGSVLWFGRIRGLNTDAFNAGDILYVSPTVAGALQTTQPLAPNNIIQVAAVVNKSATVGTIFVRPTLGSQITKDEGIKITTPAQDHTLRYQSSTGIWENKPDIKEITARGTRTQTGNFQPTLVNNGTTPFNLFQSNFSWLSSYYNVGTKIIIEISGSITLPASETLVFSLNIGGTNYTASNLVISASSTWVVRYTITISSTSEIKFNGVRMSQNSIMTGQDFINVDLNNNLDIYVQGEFSADSATNAITSNLISIDVIK